MTVPYRSQYRNPLRRRVVIGLFKVMRVLDRPVLQLGVAGLAVLMATAWLYAHTPEPADAVHTMRATVGGSPSEKVG
jgi:hypothetical protein